MSNLVVSFTKAITYKDTGWHDTGYPHDGRADNASYRHDRRADKRRYPHDREIDVKYV